MMKRERDFRVDVLKFFALFLIINSHSDIAYPKYSMLATGGAIGDCLFLFCSGYTLLLGGVNKFDNYYKRRINRIYPSVIMSVIFMLLVGYYSFQSLTWGKVLGGEFIIAIMSYYILLWFVQRYLRNYIPWLFLFVAIVTAFAYYFFPYKYETGEKGLYGISTIFRWIPYFGAMLLGAYVGIIRNSLKFCAKNDLAKLFFCVLVFYAVQLMAKKYNNVAPYQIFTFPFLLGIAFYFYKCCNLSLLRKAYDSRCGNLVIMSVGGLCLESYLIQFSIITDRFNSLFPFNIILIFVLVLVASYIVRCFARFFCQTFRTEDYDWKKIISLK